MSTSKIIVEGLIDQINRELKEGSKNPTRLVLSRSLDFTMPTHLSEIYLEAIQDKKEIGNVIKVARAFNSFTPVDYAIEDCYAELLKQIIKTAVLSK